LEILNSIDNPIVFVLKRKYYHEKKLSLIKSGDVILRSPGEYIARSNASYAIDLPEGTFEVKISKKDRIKCHT